MSFHPAVMKICDKLLGRGIARGRAEFHATTDEWCSIKNPLSLESDVAFGRFWL